MKLIKIMCIILAVLNGCPILKAQIFGHIFNDLNGNDKRDQNELALPEVTISDGFHVVKTNQEGQYELPKRDDARFVFFTVPAGYKSANKHYAKIEGGEKQYNFAVDPDETQHTDKLDLIQITDTETPLYGKWIDDIRTYAKKSRSTFIMHTGDICYDAGMHFHARQVNQDLLGTTIFYTVGNHDLVKGDYGEQLFEELFGPTYYSFEAGPAYFVVTPMWGGDYKPSYTKDQIISWLQKDLALKDKKKPLVFVNHDFEIGPDYVLRGKELELDLKEYNLKAWMFGHWHNNYVFKDSIHDVTVVSTNAPNKGGIDHAVGQFLHIQMDKQTIRSIIPRYTNLDEHIQILPVVQRNGSLELLTNIYDSKEVVDSVFARVSNKESQPLAEVNLKRRSDWTWTGNIASEGWDNYQVTLEVYYHGGSREIRRQSFQQAKKSKKGELKWSTNLGANIWKVSPLIVRDVIFVATMDDGANGWSKICALNKRSGEELWSFPAKNSIKQKLRHENGILLATDVSGTVYALDSQSGTLNWSKDLGQSRLPNYMTGGVVDKGVYYTGYGHYLSALDVKTGELLWQNADWDGGQAMPGEMLLTGDLLVTGANWNSLFVHDRKTGSLLWKRNDEGIRFRSGGVLATDNGLIVPGIDGLFLLASKTGDVLLKKKFPHEFKVMASPILAGKKVIMPSAANGLGAYDSETFEQLWNFETKEALIYTSSYTTPDRHKLVATVESTPCLLHEELIFGGSDGFIYRLDFQGNLLQEINVGAPILADITTDGTSFFVADFAGNIYCFGL